MALNCGTASPGMDGKSECQVTNGLGSVYIPSSAFRHLPGAGSRITAGRESQRGPGGADFGGPGSDLLGAGANLVVARFRVVKSETKGALAPLRQGFRGCSEGFAAVLVPGCAGHVGLPRGLRAKESVS